MFFLNLHFNIILLYVCLMRAFRLDAGLAKYSKQVGA
jgi:hypothetical protein